VILAFAFGVLLSLLALGAVTLFLGRVAGDLGVSSSYLVAGLCIAAGLYLLDWLPLSWDPCSLPGQGHSHMALGFAIHRRQTAGRGARVPG
jgi:hypothetical protein